MNNPVWPATEDAEVIEAIAKLRLLAEELRTACPEMSCSGRLEEGEMPVLQVNRGDRVLGDVYLVADVASSAEERIYGLLGDSAEVHEEDFAGTRGEIIARLIELANEPDQGQSTSAGD